MAPSGSSRTAPLISGESASDTRRRALLLSLLGLALVAVVPRLALLPAFLPIDLTGDSPGYLARAEQILRGEVMGAPDEIAVRGPVYPAFIALVYLLAPNTPASVLVAQALLAAATAAIGFYLALKHGSHLRALAVGTVLAFYPPLFFWSLHVLSEGLYVFLLALCILIADRIRHKSGVTSAVVLGLAIAATALCRPTALIYIPILVAVAVFQEGRRGPNLRLAVVIVLASALPLGTWTLRNFQHLGAPIVGTTHSGAVFYMGNSQPFLDDPRVASRPYFGDEKLRQKVAELGEVEGDRYLFELGKTFLSAEPSRVARLFWAKLLFFLRPFPDAGRVVRWISFLSVVTAITLALSVFARTQGPPCVTWFTCLALVAATIAAHVIYYPAGRFRVPAEGLLVLMGAFASHRREDI